MLVHFVTLGLLGCVAASAEPRRDAILADFLAQAQQAEPGFAGFSAERGAAFVSGDPHRGQAGHRLLHGLSRQSPQDTGQTRAGKAIEPMAVSKNPARYTDKANVEKWFTRNCNDVLGRACRPKRRATFSPI